MFLKIISKLIVDISGKKRRYNNFFVSPRWTRCGTWFFDRCFGTHLRVASYQPHTKLWQFAWFLWFNYYTVGYNLHFDGVLITLINALVTQYFKKVVIDGKEHVSDYCGRWPSGILERALNCFYTTKLMMCCCSFFLKKTVAWAKCQNVSLKNQPP